MSMLKILKTPADHKAAVARLSSLMDAAPRSGSAAASEMEVQAWLIEKYEKEHHDIGLPDPLEAIRFRMEQMGLTNKDLVPLLGSPSREVLRGRRSLSVAMMRRLHSELKIPAAVLLGETASVRRKPEAIAQPLRSKVGLFSRHAGAKKGAKNLSRRKGYSRK